MLRAITAGLVIIIIAGPGCVESTSEKIVMRGWQRTFYLGEPNPGLLKMMKGALGVKQDDSAIEDVELIAWSLKFENDLPPFCREEGILLLSPAATGSGKYRLVIVARACGAKDWCLGKEVPGVLKSVFESDVSPSDAEMMDFIRSTNFGFNECVPGISVLRIVLFRESSLLLRGIQAGIPPEEKWRRDAAMCTPLWR